MRADSAFGSLSPATRAVDVAAVERALRAHAAVADAAVVVVAGADARSQLVAFVVERATDARVPAFGRCTLVDASGRDYRDGQLVDVSRGGARILVAGDAPTVDDEVLVSIDSPAVGGVYGLVGRVAWSRDGAVGVAFCDSPEQSDVLAEIVEVFAHARRRSMSVDARGPAAPPPELGRMATELVSRMSTETASAQARAVEVVVTELSPCGVRWRTRSAAGSPPPGATVSLRIDDGADSGAIDVRATVLRVAAGDDGDVGATVVSNADRRRLVAMIGRLRGRDGLRVGDLPRHVAAACPDLALPDRYLRVDELPRTAADEIDRSALAALADWERGGFAVPADAVEDTVARVVGDVFGTAELGVGDPFSDVSAHTRERIANRLRAELANEYGPLSGLCVPRRFTVRDLARAVRVVGGVPA